MTMVCIDLMIRTISAKNGSHHSKVESFMYVYLPQRKRRTCKHVVGHFRCYIPKWRNIHIYLWGINLFRFQYIEMRGNYPLLI